MNSLKDKTLEMATEKIRAKIQARGDLPHVTVARQLELVDQLTQFEFGRHMLVHKGTLDAYWNYYWIRHNLSPFPNLSTLEKFMLEKTPYAKAGFQVFKTIQRILQERLKEGVLFASIPSGVMADLLTLDFTGLKRFELVGVDIDLKANRYAQDLAFERGLTGHVHFYERDAWKLGLKETCDGIVCEGLSYYERDETKQADLYRQLYEALKKGGFLLLTFLTPPPGMYHRCEWLLDKISLEDALLQRIVYFDVLDSSWQTYCTTDQIRHFLKNAGFKDIQIVYDEAKLMPIAIGSKHD